MTTGDLENLLEKMLILKDDLELSEAVKMLDENSESSSSANMEDGQ